MPNHRLDFAIVPLPVRVDEDIIQYPWGWRWKRGWKREGFWLPGYSRKVACGIEEVRDEIPDHVVLPSHLGIEVLFQEVRVELQFDLVGG